MNIPAEFAAKMKGLFAHAAESEAFFASLGEGRHYGLRANTLKVNVDDFMNTFSHIQPVPWCSSGFYYTGSLPASKNPLYQAGAYYIQEPSAMSAVSVLDVRPGDKVLDLCASPGGKSTQIAGLLQGAGLLVANDANHSRIPQLVRNLELAGVRNAIILREKPERLAQRFGGYFDKILVDAPCSGEGMFRKDPEALLAWDKNKSARLAIIQKNILREAAKMLSSEGYLAYSTCTFSPTENEEVIWDFLYNHKDFSLVTINHKKFGISPADEGLCPERPMPDAARIWPHKHRGEGHFVALLRREKNSLAEAPISNQPVAKFNLQHYNEFCFKYIINSPQGQIYAHNDKLYALPEACPNLTGLIVVRPGLFLGSIQKQRFTPSYALAMALTKSDFKSAAIIDLPANHRHVGLYLSGETFQIDAFDGFNLFCVDSLPLGFAKVLSGRLKGRINGI